jgi:hypothetical protein
MRNDVSIPPDDSELFDSDEMPGSHTKEISDKPIPPAEGKPVADVELFDHPNFMPSGAGNFWLLGMIGLAAGILVVLLFWVLLK